MSDDEIIALAAQCKLGHAMKPIGMDTGDVFHTDSAYRTAELLKFARAIEAAQTAPAKQPANGADSA